MKIISTILLVVFLSGCQTLRSGGLSQDKHDEIMASKNATDTYCEKLLSNPKYSELNKLGISTRLDELSLRHFSNSNKLNKRQKQLFLEYSDDRQLCIKSQFDHMHKYSQHINPMFISVRSSLTHKADLNSVKLYKGDMTIGDFAEARKRDFIEYQNDFNKIKSLIEQQNAEARYRAQQLAIERQKASAASLNSYMSTFGSSGFKTTNCNVFGSSIDCTTW